MGKKCWVEKCDSNYHRSRAKKNVDLKKKNNEKNADRFNIPTYGFPGEAEEQERWIAAIPYLTKEIYDSYKCPPRVCAKHWPVGYEHVKNVNGKPRPRHPPSIFPTKLSSIPTAPPKPRPTPTF